MSVITNIAIAAALITATGVSAGTTHLTDAQYLAAARCQGLFDSHKLGPVDASGINKMMDREGDYRQPAVADRADEARNDAEREADHAGALGRQALVSERDGACQVWASDGRSQTAAAN